MAAIANILKRMSDQKIFNTISDCFWHILKHIMACILKTMNLGFRKAP